MTQAPPPYPPKNDFGTALGPIMENLSREQDSRGLRFATLHASSNSDYSHICKLIAGALHNSLESLTEPPVWPIDKIYNWADAFFHGDDDGQPHTGHTLFSAQDDPRTAHTVLARKLAEIGSALSPGERLPVDTENRRRLLSPMEQFNRIEWHDSFYPYGVGDIQNFVTRTAMHADMIDGANVLELGVGDGIKTRMIVKHLAEADALAHAFYLNDNVASNVETAQRRIATVFHDEAERLGRPHNQGINGVCDDLFAPSKDRLQATLTGLRESKRPTVVWWNGASINSHKFDRLKDLFTLWAEAFKTGTRIAVSVDCTLDPQPLKKAYANPFFKQLFVTSLVHPYREMGIDIDLGCLHVDVEIGQPEAHGVVPVRGKFMSDQIFTLPKGLMYSWPKHQSFVSNINKFPFEGVLACVDAGGLQVQEETTCADPRYPGLNLKQLILTQKTRTQYACG